MVALLQSVAFVVLVAVAFAGFIIALAWTLAIWFGKGN
jgi:hypothetical protein